MIYLNLNNDKNIIIELNEDSGIFQILNSVEQVEKTFGNAILLDNEVLLSKYLTSEGTIFQVGETKWLLSDKNVKCSYFRFFSYEFFSISDKSNRKFKVKLKSKSPFIRGITNDPTYDELDKYCDYFLYQVWSNWKKIQSKKL